MSLIGTCPTSHLIKFCSIKKEAEYSLLTKDGLGDVRFPEITLTTHRVVRCPQMLHKLKTRYDTLK